MILHVSVCDHHQEARTRAKLKLQFLKCSVKIRRFKPCSGVAVYCVKSMLVCMQCVVQNETEQSDSAVHTAYTPT